MPQRLNVSMSQCLNASAHNVSIICHKLIDIPLLVLPTTIFLFAGRVIDYSYGLNLALAGKGVIVKDQAFLNLNSSQLQHKGATIAESLSGLPLLVRGHVPGGGPSEISKPHFTKLLKQVTNHISSISNIFVHDGAIGSSPKCDAKVRLISDSPSAMLSLSRMLWETPTRAVSHDSCPLTVYVATSISPGIGESIGLGSKENDGFIAADIERSSLILCGKAFSDSNATKEALAALSGPVIFARGGLPLSARLLVSGDSVVLLFAPKRTFKSCRDLLVPSDAGVILSSKGLAFLFQTGGSNLFTLPASVFLASSDSSGVIPSVSKLSPGQAAYHFLAGYQNGKFIPAYNKGTWSIDPLELAKAFLSKLKDDQISSYLFNVDGGENNVNGSDFVKVVQSTLSENIPPFRAKSGGDLEEKYKSFLLSKFPDLPEEFSF
ncbi:uncharacterized protein LOC110758560 isoform X1 [Prunus avium]|uniref:phosphoenolpyruvate carboxykinase (ATP) n=1 Tax=Prunus avium TaxID=42229 RepID=A0A6P5SR15_PRUAV|nr:uncharacterized protein LOC110758560 isoform X1 [Prunus avium]